MTGSESPGFIHIGTGGWGQVWCEVVLRRLVELGKARPVAAVDLDARNLENAQRGYGLAPERCYTDVEQAFSEHAADFAVVVVPPSSHEAVIDIALAHGCHILSEKPIADTIEATARIHAKVKAAGRKMAVTMSHRFDQDKQTLERLIHSGRYGPLDSLVCRFSVNLRHFGDWGAFRHEIDDSLLIEGTIHHFDVMRGLCRSDGRSVYARTWNPEWGEYAGDSNAHLLVEMANGVKVFYEASVTSAAALNPWLNEYWRAECRDATIELDRRSIRVLRSTVPGAEPEVTSVELDERPAWMNSWLAEMFVDWLNGGEPVPTHIEDNIRCSAMLFAAIESAHTGQRVDVERYVDLIAPG